MCKLLCETNEPEVEQQIEAAFKQWGPQHERLQTNFEHGQWWVTCLDCGGQWSVCDAAGPGTADGFDFEEVSEPDEFCDQKEDT